MGAREYFCYTDGACKPGEDSPGGWGFHIRTPSGPPLEGYGKSVRTLAKVMEYRAAAEALAALSPGVRVILFSDNESLVENLTKRLVDWRANGFAKVDPLIVDSVQKIEAQISSKGLVVEFRWIRAHNGNPGNERADSLAAQGAREAKEELRGRNGKT